MQIETLDVRLQLAEAFLPLRMRVTADALQNTFIDEKPGQAGVR